MRVSRLAVAAGALVLAFMSAAPVSAQERTDSVELSLTAALSMAQERSEEVRVAEQQVRVASAQVRSARSSLLPGTSFDLRIGESLVNYTGSPKIAHTVNGSLPAPTLRGPCSFILRRISTFWTGKLVPGKPAPHAGRAGDGQTVREGGTQSHGAPRMGASRAATSCRWDRDQGPGTDVPQAQPSLQEGPPTCSTSSARAPRTRRVSP